MANKERKLLELEIDDVKDFFSANRDHGFIERIMKNAATYCKIFNEVIDVHMPNPSLNFREEDLTSFDVIMD